MKKNNLNNTNKNINKESNQLLKCIIETLMKLDNFKHSLKNNKKLQNNYRML